MEYTERTENVACTNQKAKYPKPTQWTSNSSSGDFPEKPFHDKTDHLDEEEEYNPIINTTVDKINSDLMEQPGCEERPDYQSHPSCDPFSGYATSNQKMPS